MRSKTAHCRSVGDRNDRRTCLSFLLLYSLIRISFPQCSKTGKTNRYKAKRSPGTPFVVTADLSFRVTAALRSTARSSHAPKPEEVQSTCKCQARSPEEN